MTLKSWKDEFYSLEACFTEPEEALQHSLTKWEGLKKASLTKHRVEAHRFNVRNPHDVNEGTLYVDSSTCALCQHYQEDGDDWNDDGELISLCRECPIYKIRNAPCDHKSVKDKNEKSPWHHWTIDNDPMPMIRLIRKAIKKEQNAA